jgi:hypothetical protein
MRGAFFLAINACASLTKKERVLVVWITFSVWLIMEGN